MRSSLYAAARDEECNGSITPSSSFSWMNRHIVGDDFPLLKSATRPYTECFPVSNGPEVTEFAVVDMSIPA